MMHQQTRPATSFRQATTSAGTSKIPVLSSIETYHIAHYSTLEAHPVNASGTPRGESRNASQ